MRTRAWPVAALALALVAAACGGDDGGRASATTVPSATTADPTAGPSTEASEQDAADPTTDPARAPDVSATAVAPSGSTTAPPPVSARPALAQAKPELRQLATLDEPVAFAVRPGDVTHTYVAQRAGLIVTLDAGGNEGGAPVADLRGRTVAGGERGLLGLTFSPDGSKLYVDYTDRNGDTNVDELTMQPDGAAAASSRRRLLVIEQPYSNHNGGHVVTGPDGMLYIGMGDGGSGGDPQGNGQDLGVLLGKLLRIDPTPAADGSPYTVPADNPFVGRAGVRPEIWSYGLRNPWRFSFDPATGDLWVGDVGQDAWEELDVVRVDDPAAPAGRGANFGWNAFEGTHRYDDGVTAAAPLLEPIHDYPHGGGDLQGCSVTGGVVYRGSAIANLSGAYLFADYCVAGVRGLDAAAGDDQAGDGVRRLTAGPTAIASFGTDPNGAVLVASLDGGVYRLELRRAHDGTVDPSARAAHPGRGRQGLLPRRMP